MTRKLYLSPLRQVLKFSPFRPRSTKVNKDGGGSRGWKHISRHGGPSHCFPVGSAWMRWGRGAPVGGQETRARGRNVVPESAIFEETGARLKFGNARPTLISPGFYFCLFVCLFVFVLNSAKILLSPPLEYDPPFYCLKNMLSVVRLDSDLFSCRFYMLQYSFLFIPRSYYVHLACSSALLFSNIYL